MIPIRTLLVTVLLVGLMVAFLVWTRPPAQPSPPALTLVAVSPEATFARAESVQSIQLPLDHGPHPAYQTEWWYYTGNLETEIGRHFGYQLTFFRRGLTPAPPPREAALATDQIYFAHFAVTDVESGEHLEWERFSRGAGGLAGAEAEPFRVQLEDWSAESLTVDGSRVRLQAEAEGTAIDLNLRAEKPITLHGQGGLSPKSEQAGNASYYLSYSRMTTEGTLRVKDGIHAVRGESWFDHEWSTSALGPEAVGWDWFSLQLTDGWELMYFQIRRGDGTVEPVSSGTLVAPDGTATRVPAEDVELQPLDEWRSEQSGANYPVRWRIRVPSANLSLTIEPWLEDQEMNVSTVYWEGAVKIEGERAGDRVTGNGYLEMTGYAGTMQGGF